MKIAHKEDYNTMQKRCEGASSNVAEALIRIMTAHFVALLILHTHGQAQERPWFLFDCHYREPWTLPSQASLLDIVGIKRVQVRNVTLELFPAGKFSFKCQKFYHKKGIPSIFLEPTL